MEEKIRMRMDASDAILNEASRKNATDAIADAAGKLDVSDVIQNDATGNDAPGEILGRDGCKCLRPEELAQWAHRHEPEKRIDVTEAALLIQYVGASGYALAKDAEDRLLWVDVEGSEYVYDETTLDEVIGTVCEWNYEFIDNTRNQMGFCADEEECWEKEDYLADLLEDEKKLDAIFCRTDQARGIFALAKKWAHEIFERMKKHMERSVDRTESFLDREQAHTR